MNSNSSNSPPKISYGSSQGKILVVLSKIKSLGVNEASRATDCASSTASRALGILEKKGLCKRELGVYVVTETGQALGKRIEMALGGVLESARFSRGEIRMHHFEVRGEISWRKDNWNTMIKSLGKVETQKWNNSQVTMIESENGDSYTVQMFTKRINIWIKVLQGESELVQSIDGFERCRSICEKLFDCGVCVKGIFIDDLHYGRMNTYFSEYLLNILDRYYFVMPDGSKVWVDRSKGQSEEETNRDNIRKNVNMLMSQMNDEKDIPDMRQMARVLGMLVQLQLTDSRFNINQSNLNQYIGDGK